MSKPSGEISKGPPSAWTDAHVDDAWVVLPVRLSSIVVAALAWMAGIVAGDALPQPMFWLICASLMMAAGVALHLLDRPTTVVRPFVTVALAATAAMWAGVQLHHTQPNDIRQYLDLESKLAHIAGVMEGDSHLTSGRRGQFAAFGYHGPGTLLVLNVQQIMVEDQWQDVTGRILVKIDQAVPTHRHGDRLEAVGWLRGLDGPSNPGDFDYRQILLQQGIFGRLTTPASGGVRLIERQPIAANTPIASLRAWLSRQAAASLRIGIDTEADRLALLDVLLLGRKNLDLVGLDESFRRVGLGHLLAISGAHLGVLMGMVYLVARLLLRHPPYAAAVALAVLGVYLLTVPPRVPILRAGVMAAIYFAGVLAQRRGLGLDLLALAALIVLTFNPADLFSPGFQLSFGVVAGLILFTRPVRVLIYAAEPWREGIHLPADPALRFVASYLAVSIVSFLVATPIVAHHFQIITPLAILLSVLAWPAISLLLALGYLKIVAGMVIPSAGHLIAGPLGWSTEVLATLVEHASGWPGATIDLATPPSAGWTVATLGVMAGLLAGAFRRRRVAMSLCLFIVFAWLIFSQTQFVALAERPDGRAATLTMFAVGNGSCFLLRIPDENGQDYRILFDCGSQEYMDVGSRSILPALRMMGVDRIDLLMISHADIDHFGGVLDLADGLLIDEVVAPPQLLKEAESSRQAGKPNAATFLVQQLAAKQLTVQAIHAGWARRVGDASLNILWPPRDFDPKRTNDTSLVLDVEVAGRRLLLNGDISQEATEGLFADDRVQPADVTDLPHHGSFVDASLQWFNQVNPQIVLQSSGPHRLYVDRWEDRLGPTSDRPPRIGVLPADYRDIPDGADIADHTDGDQIDRPLRFVTARDGTVEVVVGRTGVLSWGVFADDADRVRNRY